jgi:hypothetical protein
MSDEIKEALQFVKKFTSVPEKFVEEMFRFYTPKTSQTDPVILLDNVAKWLGAPKRSLYITLSRTYVRGVDYVSEKASNPFRTPGQKSNNYIRVMLTPDCFKRMCMLSKTKNAEMVRSYFIDAEVGFLRHREQIIEGLRNDLNPRRMKLPPKASGGYLYIIRAADDTNILFKIGRASDLKARLFSYQTGRAHEVVLLYVLKVNDMKSAERCVKDHVQAFQYRTRREVYQVPLNMLKVVMGKCNAIDGVTKEYVRRQALHLHPPNRGGTKGGAAPNNTTTGFYAMFSRNLILPGP